jgi:thiol-disulfide isomerase/thioredoxin
MAALLAAAALAAGCGGAQMDDAADPGRGDTPSASSVPAATSGAVPAATSDAVPAALRFAATTLSGKKFEGASLAGKPVVFWFWAPWCPKCLSEAPAVKKAAAAYQDVAFVGVASLDTEAAMKEFVRRTGTDGIVQLSDEKGAVWAKLGVAQRTAPRRRPRGR